MNEHLRQTEQYLRSLSKKYKSIKFSIGMVILFLMMGVGAFSEEVVAQEVMTTEQITSSKEKLKNSVETLQSKIDKARIENEKGLAGLRLELIQLMEQGDQVVKSPWASWQFGANYMYSKWNGTYKGKGDKAEKYAFEGVFVRGNWWENNVSPDSKAYSKLEISSSGKNSSLTNRRKNVDYGLVKTVPVVDKGVPFIIEPVININTPPLPNLNINPVTVNPNIGFNIPKVNTMSFEEIIVNKIEPNVFEPPALNEVSTGFAQGQEIGLNTNQNYIVSNSTVNLVDNDVNIKIKDTGYEGRGKFSWDGHSDNRSRRNRPAEGGVHGTTDSAYSYIHTAGAPVASEYSSNSNSPGLGFLDDSITRTDKKFPMNTNWRPVGDPSRREYGPSSQQVFLNVLTDGFNLDGAGKTLTFENHTAEPWSNTSNGLVRTNTVRVISVNHAYGSVNKTIEFNLNADLRIFGRDGYNDKMTSGNPKNANPAPHMTVGIEHQAYGSVAARAINNGTMTLEKDSKKTNGLATYMVGMTAMVEDYGDYGHTLSPDDPNANAGIDPTWYLKDGDTDAAGFSSNKWKYRRQAPWESTLENKGTIKVNSIDSIGMDFAEYTFRADLAGTMYQSDNISGSTPNPKGKLPAYNNKGSLNIYARVGNIELNSEDPDGGVYSGIQGSYGLRVPNIFKNADNSQVYYDETVIDGSLNTGNPKGIVTNGSHNVGVSISKLITGSDRVRKYQAGELATQPVDGAKTYLVARPDTDPIGNIYNLNILVNGKENVGLLRKSDYMQGSKYDLNNFMPGLARSKNDFVITDSHVQSIDFSKDAKGGVLFRTDKYGIDLAKNNFTVTAMENQNKDASGNDMYNIVMLANGSVNSVVAGAPAEDNLNANNPVKVKNTKPITIGSTANTGFNMVGLMAYKGGEFENNSDVTLNTKHSIALVVEGEGVRGANKKESSGTSNNSNIKVTGDNSIAVYNNGRNYTMNGGEINISGEKNVGVFAAGVPTYDHAGNITGYSNLATTTLNNGSLKVAGKGSVGLYANGGSDIKLDTMTNMLVKENSLLFYGIKHNTDYSQLELVGTNTATIEKGAYAFYFKNSNLLNQVVKPGSTGKLELTLQDGATLNIIEGDGTTPVLLSNIPTVTLNTGTDNEIVSGIVIKAASGNYITTKSTKVNLQMDMDSNLDNKNDRYLNSEFSSSSVTLMPGKTISGSGVLTTADTSAEKVEKAKVAIAQSNVSTLRSAVKLTNNGTINFTGTGMAGIVGEYSEINNNSTINVTGANSTGIISANGSLATNNGTINIGNGGTGLA
ncbi:autotransporter-associated N-terminal domain-containing protein, partial [Fusobacterium hwasookii]